MILAAGLGTRLRPLTDSRPKALVEVAGRTLLEMTLTRLRSFGINEVIINVHHFADMVVDYLKSTIDLRGMLQFHNHQGALATLAVRSRASSRLLLFDDKNLLVGRRISGKDTLIPSAARESAFSSHPPLLLAFSGIHVISPRLLGMLNEEGAFSIIDAYLRLAAEGQKILAFRADQYYWRDLGRPSDLSQAALDVQQKIVE